MDLLREILDAAAKDEKIRERAPTPLRTVTNGRNDGRSELSYFEFLPFLFPFSPSFFFLPLFSRQTSSPIPLRALFIAGRRVKIASHDVNEAVV